MKTDTPRTDAVLQPYQPTPAFSRPQWVSADFAITLERELNSLRQKRLKRTEKMIDVSDWDELVKETYGRPYSFQQQDGFKSRGVFRFSVPSEAEDHEQDAVPEVVNHSEMGVSFAAWLKRDPKAPLADGLTDYSLELWWERNFYPKFQMVANDLNAKGLLEAGEYTIDIDW